MVRLGDVTKKIGSGATPRGGASVYVDEGPAFIRSQNVYDHSFSSEGLVRLSDEAARALRGVTVEPDDVLICITGESVTRTAMVPGWVLPARVSQHVAIVRSEREKLAPQYLEKFLLSPPVKAELNRLSEAGATRRALTKSHLESLVIPLPPIVEQRRIAEVLGALDDLIDTHEQLKSGLDELARATFLRAWDGETWTTVAELGEVIMGQSPPGDTYSETPVGVPFHQGVRDFGARFPSSRIYCSAPTRIAEAGDILIAVRAPVGEMNVAPERLAIGRGLAALRATRPSTALQAIRAFESTWSAYQGTGTVFSSINGKDLRAAKVPFVDDDLVEAALAELDNAYAELDREGVELRRTRDELLPPLMSGAVRVRPEGVAA